MLAHTFSHIAGNRDGLFTDMLFAFVSSIAIYLCVQTNFGESVCNAYDIL